MLGGLDVKDLKINFLYNDGTTATIEQLKFLIHKHDFVHIGFQIYEGFYQCNNINYIASFTGANLGGHAMVCCGFLPEGLIIQNSWGPNFGSKGFCIIKWEDVIDHFMYGCVIEK